MNDKVCQVKKERISSIELLRIISMLLVLVIHANQWTEKIPMLNLRENPVSSSATIFLQTLSCVCVNVFVLISGWFGIRFSYRGMLKFVFQCLFFLCGIYSVMVCLHLRDFNVEGIMGCFFLLKWNWFIKVYLLLYIISPVLNRFLDNTNKKELERILLLFFAFQTLYGFFTDAAQFFVWGLSLTSFVGLYLLAQYIKRYHYGRTDSFVYKYCNGVGYMLLFLITFTVAMISSYYE